MSKLKTTSLLLTGVCAVAGVTLAMQDTRGISVANLSCDCEANIQYNTSLPKSHPANQCAIAETQQSTTWFGWATGNSRSISFHFLDLLELISKTDNKQIDANKKQRPVRDAA
ncbi:hypothetical protein [Echinimonas agarilytica]|uniref:Uncharacterized protein n=1 Tax=Echinimonas agarilytica TaxID=1215918 RepID=A0AA41W3X3_9GAMM|nr:hypothetical protein [Echinimonas agarilytica]MCM2678349.1 hypothetical protein [Echinimonas agarilytica]